MTPSSARFPARSSFTSREDQRNVTKHRGHCTSVKANALDMISSMLAIPKKNEKIRICLDPKDLNQAILRENYPIPTIEDIATHFHGAKVFSVLDIRNGFWHVKLDEESSYLTSFHTPFGRYRTLEDAIRDTITLSHFFSDVQSVVSSYQWRNFSCARKKFP